MRVAISNDDVCKYPNEAARRAAFRERRERFFPKLACLPVVAVVPRSDPDPQTIEAHVPSSHSESFVALKRLNRRIRAVQSLLDRLEDKRVVAERLAQPSIETIMRTVAQHFGVSVLDLQSPRRDMASVRPRQIAAYLARHLTTRSLPQIGRKMGGRDHTTMIAAVRKVVELRACDPEIDKAVTEIEAILRGRA